MRWKVLAALTLARTVMGLQFQSVAALGPELRAEHGLSYAALGALFGLYLLPGVLVAIPGGWLGRRFGDIRVVYAGLAMMVIGDVLSGLGFLWSGRLVAGSGAVLLNVLATKVVSDWFEPRQLPLAMGLLITSWPAGIGLAMVLLPPLSGWLGHEFAQHSVTVFAGLALLSAVLGARDRAQGVGVSHARLGRRDLSLAIVAGAVWTFYNAGLILVIAFVPDLLSAGGMSTERAAALASLVGWLIVPSLVLGGWLQSQVARPHGLTILCLVAATATLAGLVSGAPPAASLVVIGLILGPPGPLIMTLPAAVLAVESRSLGFAVYFTCYYVGMAVAPAIAGWLRDVTGDPAAPIWLAGALLIASGAALVLLRKLAR